MAASGILMFLLMRYLTGCQGDKNVTPVIPTVSPNPTSTLTMSASPQILQPASTLTPTPILVPTSTSTPTLTPIPTEKDPFVIPTNPKIVLDSVPTPGIEIDKLVQFLDLRQGINARTISVGSGSQFDTNSIIFAANKFPEVTKGVEGCRQQYTEDDPLFVIYIDKEGADEFGIKYVDGASGRAGKLSAESIAKLKEKYPMLNDKILSGIVSFIQTGGGDISISDHEFSHTYCVTASRATNDLPESAKIDDVKIDVNFGESTFALVTFGEDFTVKKRYKGRDYEYTFVKDNSYISTLYEELAINILGVDFSGKSINPNTTLKESSFNKEIVYNNLVNEFYTLLANNGFKGPSNSLQYTDLIELTKPIRLGGVKDFWKSLKEKAPEDVEFTNIQKDITLLLIQYQGLMLALQNPK